MLVVNEQDPKTAPDQDPDELPLEILDVVHGGRRDPYSKGELEEMVRRIHTPEPASPGLVIPPSPPKRAR
jgi:hypothetical protein